MQAKPRGFKQSVELIVNFKDIDVKKGFAINEVVQLPKNISPSTVCVMATGDMGHEGKAGQRRRGWWGPRIWTGLP